MSPVLAIAASALQTEGLRSQEAAHNIANVNSLGFAALDLRSDALAGGGVRGEIVDGPDLDSELAQAELSNVDLEQEFADLVLARRSYQANLALIQGEDARSGQLFNAFAGDR